MVGQVVGIGVADVIERPVLSPMTGVPVDLNLFARLRRGQRVVPEDSLDHANADPDLVWRPSRHVHLEEVRREPRAGGLLPDRRVGVPVVGEGDGVADLGVVAGVRAPEERISRLALADRERRGRRRRARGGRRLRRCRRLERWRRVRACNRRRFGAAATKHERPNRQHRPGPVPRSHGESLLAAPAIVVIAIQAELVVADDLNGDRHVVRTVPGPSQAVPVADAGRDAVADV